MSPQKSLTPRATVDLLLLSGIWGASFLAIRVALDEIGPLTVVLHRCGWAMVLLWAVVLWRGSEIPKSPSVWAAFALQGLLNNVIPFGLIAWGQLHVETGLAAIFNAMTAIFGVLVAALFFSDERLTRRKVLGVLLGFGGVLLVIGLDALQTLDLRSLAQLAIIGATISYAFAGAWGRLSLSHLKPEVAAAGMLTGSTVIMLPLAWAFEGAPSLQLAPETGLAIAYYAVMATAVAYLLYFRIIQNAGAGNMSLCTLLLVPIAIALGAWVRQESLAASAYAGFALISLGLLIITGRLLRRL